MHLILCLTIETQPEQWEHGPADSITELFGEKKKKNPTKVLKYKS